MAGHRPAPPQKHSQYRPLLCADGQNDDSSVQPQAQTRRQPSIAAIRRQVHDFLCDQAQLPPIGGPAVYGDKSKPTKHMMISKKKESNSTKCTSARQAIFENYLLPNCIYLQRSQRNTELLGPNMQSHAQRTADGKRPNNADISESTVSRPHYRLWNPLHQRYVLNV